MFIGFIKVIHKTNLPCAKLIDRGKNRGENSGKVWETFFLWKKFSTR
jgi:hypothetical protein